MTLHIKIIFSNVLFALNLSFLIFFDSTRLIRSFKYCLLKIYGCLEFRFRKTHTVVEEEEKKLFSLFEIVLWGEVMLLLVRMEILTVI